MTGNIINHKLFERENKPVSFSGEIMEKIRQLIIRYPENKKKSALLPVLHMAQEELGGYLSVDVMDYVASLLDLQSIEVYEVATFYSMFYLEPAGKYVIEVCQTGPCAVCGAENIIDHLQQKLGIRSGETTPDGLFTLRTVECLGGCGYAPVMQVNTEFFEMLTPEKVDNILHDLKTRSDLEKPATQRWVEKFC